MKVARSTRFPAEVAAPGKPVSAAARYGPTEP